MVSFQGSHFAATVILTCTRWYLAYPLSYRPLEEMMLERGVVGRSFDARPLGIQGRATN
jgi:transposase-like protein